MKPKRPPSLAAQVKAGYAAFVAKRKVAPGFTYRQQITAAANVAKWEKERRV